MSLVVGLNAVIVAVTGHEPRILTVRRAEHALAPAAPEPGDGADGERWDALPFGPLDPQRDRTLERALRGWVCRQTGIELGYVEQLYTFADRDRGPRARDGGPRVVSVAYLALVREGRVAGAGEAAWRSWYAYFPWEDARGGRSPLIAGELLPRLDLWARRAEDAASEGARRARIDITFGTGGARWDAERVLERYELLYEAGIVSEAWRDRATAGERGLPEPCDLGDRPMALDHRRIVATALGRLRGKLAYRPVVFELLPETFTLLQLQEVVEALAGMPLHKQNFRRLVEGGGLVEGTGGLRTHTGGRPAALFRFRSEVLRERPAPGVGLPGRR
jgi:hypothetical protein